ncbi:hypothetical protein GCM10027077_20670 [Arenimonas maotaiensis]
MLGAYITRAVRAMKKRIIVTRSLKIKYGCIGAFSAFELIPSGFELPCECSVSICTRARAARINGSR